MKKFQISPLLVLVVVAFAMNGCSALNRNASSDDLYSTHNKIAIAQREAAEAELAKAQALAEKARYEKLLAEQQAADAEQAYYNSLRADNNTRYVDDADVVVVDSRYARKLYMFDNSDVYVMPLSYYMWSYSSYYDPYYYNMPPRYWNSYMDSWGWGLSFSGAGWHFYWNSSWYDPWYSPYYYPWYPAHYPIYHPAPIWPGYGPGPGSGAPHYGSRPSHQPGYRTFDNGYKAPIATRKPSVSGAPSHNNSPSRPAGNYRNDAPSRSDFTRPGRPTNGSSQSRVETTSPSRPSSNSSSGNGGTSTTYRRGTSSGSSNSSTISRPSPSSSSHSSFPSPSSGGNRSGGGFSGGSPHSGSGRNPNGR